ncbi:histidine kinase [Nonomuraea sp. NPDC004580]|uniref:sensor histidine kinase n=1 Tax=Nonomuraea sp. NPDC004580 TaxID=3154552 RepID=UPI0033B3AA9B
MGRIEQARSTTRKVLGFAFLASWILIGLSVFTGVSDGRIIWWRVALGAVAAAGFTWVSWQVVDELLNRRYPTRKVVVAAVLAVLAAALGGAEPVGWGFLLLCWLSIAVLEISRRWSYVVAAGTWVTGVGLSALTGGTMLSGMVAGMTTMQRLSLDALMYGLLCVLIPPSNRVWMWIWGLAVEAHRGKEAHTRLALAEERLRFSRDLHDLVGHQLSAIAVKTELAVRLSDVDPGAAKAEMAEVNALTRKALKELRQAVRGYRELDLAAELNSVRSVLEAAGVRCEVKLPHREAPDGVAPVFAFAVREAVTNVLKHSTATFCDISFRFTADEAELTVRNDGVAHRKAADLGSGLAGLSERLAAVGGAMTAQPTGDGQFLLRAVVSLPMAG